MTSPAPRSPGPGLTVVATAPDAMAATSPYPVTGGSSPVVRSGSLRIPRAPITPRTSLASSSFSTREPPRAGTSRCRRRSRAPWRASVATVSVAASPHRRRDQRRPTVRSSGGLNCAACHGATGHGSPDSTDRDHVRHRRDVVFVPGARPPTRRTATPEPKMESGPLRGRLARRSRRRCRQSEAPDARLDRDAEPRHPRQGDSRRRTSRTSSRLSRHPDSVTRQCALPASFAAVVRRGATLGASSRTILSSAIATSSSCSTRSSMPKAYAI